MATEAPCVTHAELTRWRIMALLVETLQEREFVPITAVKPGDATDGEVVAVMHEARMRRISFHVWTPGTHTTAWVVLHTEGADALTPFEREALGVDIARIHAAEG
jgi:hypothetical protein